jgi:hypothetical protein
MRIPLDCEVTAALTRPRGARKVVTLKELLVAVAPLPHRVPKFLTVLSELFAAKCALIVSPCPMPRDDVVLRVNCLEPKRLPSVDATAPKRKVFRRSEVELNWGRGWPRMVELGDPGEGTKLVAFSRVCSK